MSALMLRRRGVEAVRRGAFTPSDITGLKLWVKGDGTHYQETGRTTLVSSDGDPIGSLSDGSSSALHGAQATSAKKAVLKTGANGLNGLPIVRFDGVDDAYATATLDLTGSNKMTMFIVYKAAATGDHVLIEHGTDHNSDQPGFLVYRGGDTYPHHGVNANDFRSNTALTTTAAIFATTWDQSLAGASEAVVYRNGVTGQTRTNSVENSGNFGNKVLYIGGRAATSIYWNGDLAELLIYNSVLSTTDLNRVGNYLERWGMTWTDV